jgi:small-conductance mechanosensitive channel
MDQELVPAWVDGSVREILAIELLHFGEHPLTLGALVAAVLIIVSTLLISRWVRLGVRRAFLARGVSDPGRIGVTSRLVHYAVLLVGFSAALDTAGVELSALFAAGAIFAVGLGFAMQTLVENFVSGIILLAERAIKPGDVLLLNGEPVRVKSMYIRTTVVRTLDDVDTIVPNSVLASGQVQNFSYDRQLVRLRATVGVHYDSDMTQVREVLEEAARSFGERSAERDPVVILLGFGNSSVDWEVSVWVTDPWVLRQARGRLNERIWRRLKAHGVTIPYPQLDLHIKEALQPRIEAEPDAPTDLVQKE